MRKNAAVDDCKITGFRRRCRRETSEWWHSASAFRRWQRGVLSTDQQAAPDDQGCRECMDQWRCSRAPTAHVNTIEVISKGATVLVRL